MDFKIRKPRIDAPTPNGKVEQLITAINVLIDEINLLFESSIDKVYLEGKDGAWKYKRWTSGKAECHGSIPITLSSWNESTGILTAIAESIPLPAGLFKETPKIYLSISTDALISTGGIRAYKNAFIPSFIRFDGNNTNIDLTLGVCAVGRWI